MDKTPTGNARKTKQPYEAPVVERVVIDPVHEMLTACGAAKGGACVPVGS